MTPGAARAARHLALWAALWPAPVAAQAVGGAAGGTVLGTGTTRALAVGAGSVVVYLVPVEVQTVRPDPPQEAQIDQRDLRFVPRVIAVSPGSTVAFPNSDPVMHNVFHPSVSASGFDLGTYPQGERRSFSFMDEGAYVIFCHVHPEMVAYVVVVASPYRTVTDAEGRFRLDGVPPGTYHLRTWHRRLRTEDRLVTVPATGVVRADLALSYGFPLAPRAARPRHP